MVMPSVPTCSPTLRLVRPAPWPLDRKSTRPNSSHTDIYTLSLHDALPIWIGVCMRRHIRRCDGDAFCADLLANVAVGETCTLAFRSEEHTSELQSHRYIHSFPTRRSSDLDRCVYAQAYQTLRW